MYRLIQAKTFGMSNAIHSGNTPAAHWLSTVE
jgi:hypothetical protein